MHHVFQFAFFGFDSGGLFSKDDMEATKFLTFLACFNFFFFCFQLKMWVKTKLDKPGYSYLDIKKKKLNIDDISLSVEY